MMFIELKEIDIIFVVYDFYIKFLFYENEFYFLFNDGI